MPRTPEASRATAPVGGSVFSPLAHRIPELAGPVFPLHVGDTWLEPCDGARMQDLTVAAHPGMHRYTPTRGLPELVDALVDKVRAENALACERDELLVAGGATAGLGAAVGAVCDPGEEILILAPFWPLIRGVVQSFRGVPVEVPFYDRVDSAEAAVEAVRERITPRSVALYVSTPSNPTGRVLPADWLCALAELARAENLWLISDEVYEQLVHRGEHVSIGGFAPERTVTAFSFSKTWAMAGNRLGYLVGPAALIAEAHKIGIHTIYCAPQAAQLAGLQVLRHGADWLARARRLYREAGDTAAAQLGLAPPEGATFLFVDATSCLDERGVLGFLEDCLEDGVVLAPGASCGRDYESWVRVCYTAAAPDVVQEGMRRLARRLGRG